MKSRTVSSVDVAKLAGVSHATVSYVLNKRTDRSISDTTRQRVLDAARDLKYRPNRLVNGVLRGKTSMIGLIAPWLESQFHVSILNGIRQILDEHGYHAFVSWGKQEPLEQAREVEILLEHRVDGIIYVSEGNRVPEHASTWLDEVLAEGVKCVVVDDKTLSDKVDCVVSDDVSGAMQAVAHLVALGHRRIAFLSNTWHSSSYRDRVDGYKQGLAAAGLPFDEALCIPVPADSRKMAIVLHQMLNMPDRPTAVFTTNDIPAMILRHAADDTGIRVPADIAIVGYANMDYATNTALTTIRQDSDAMGREAARLLLKRLKDGTRAPAVVHVPTELIVRSSTVYVDRPDRFDAVPDELRATLAHD